MAGRQLADKWRKTKALLTDPSIAVHVPQTRIYQTAELKRMLRQFGMVVIKPICGGGGYGVIRVELEGGKYRYTSGTVTKTCRSFEVLCRSLDREKVKRKYIIQQGVRLARISDRPIDYRFKMVKEGKTWVCKAMVGRMAKEGLFVTNLCKGGVRLTAREGLRRSVGPKRVQGCIREMRGLTERCLTVLERAFPGLGQLGFDYGVDERGRIWIFEVNTRPQ
ncbi:hypothetical protein DCC85_17855 [Paenibacillus sp. CAA11]|uniref:YheC/YheD family protein n=1 Tax=Paenibacillus sp. CAA11 TaxID=1532905 RepID=UPI000D3C3A76|nr:YheC/YheD family protein [Paenibacillus sp. CAA11]AWB45868.1 hypothetical protein DCC85_17855 [Paenibacillus sp. CAA11]